MDRSPTHNAIFKGGGAKGIAYAGALDACEEAGIVFGAVAGASAGAISATLVACGYESNELRALMPDALASTGSPKRSLLRFGRRSLLASDRLHDWVAAVVADRVRPGWDRNGDPPCVTFAELVAAHGVELFVVTMDLATRQPLILCRQLTPHVPVADAVVASCAIPVAFPAARFSVGDEVHRVVDGGTWANYPAFVFHDQDFRQFHDLREGPDLPTIGFVLDEPGAKQPPSQQVIRRAIGPPHWCDRGSSADELGLAGAMMSSRVVRAALCVGPVAFVILACFSIVREAEDGYPAVAEFPYWLQTPVVLTLAALVAVSSVAALAFGLFAVRFARETADTGIVGAVAAMGVGPSVPYWVQTDPSARRIVIRIEAPRDLSTLSFRPSAALVSEALSAGRVSAQRALVAAGLQNPSVATTRADSDETVRPHRPHRPHGPLRRLAARLRPTSPTSLGTATYLLTLTLASIGGAALTAQAIIELPTRPQWAVAWLMAGGALLVAAIGVASARRAALVAVPYPHLRRLGGVALSFVGVAATALGVALVGVLASDGTSVAALSNSETSWARVWAIDETGDTATLLIPADKDQFAQMFPGVAADLVDRPFISRDEVGLIRRGAVGRFARPCRDALPEFLAGFSCVEINHPLVDWETGQAWILHVDLRSGTVILPRDRDPLGAFSFVMAGILALLGGVSVATHAWGAVVWRRSRRNLEVWSAPKPDAASP